MKRKLLIAPAVLLFLFGLGVLLYPTIRTAAFRQAERREIRRKTGPKKAYRSTLLP